MSNMDIKIKDLADNPTTRVPICVLLDTSGSMEGTPIEELNKGIKMFIDELKNDIQTLYSADLSIITFGDNVDIIKDFGPLEGYNTEILHADGVTPMGEAVETALKLLNERKEQYKDQMIEYYQPWLVLMTDGVPTDDYLNAAYLVTNQVNAKKLVVFPVAIGTQVDFDILKSFSPNKDPLQLKGLKFKPFFQWLSASVSQLSQSMPGEKVKIDVKGIASWAEDGLDGLFGEDDEN